MDSQQSDDNYDSRKGIQFQIRMTQFLLIDPLHRKASFTFER